MSTMANRWMVAHRHVAQAWSRKGDRPKWVLKLLGKPGWERKKAPRGFMFFGLCDCFPPGAHALDGKQSQHRQTNLRGASAGRLPQEEVQEDEDEAGGLPGQRRKRVQPDVEDLRPEGDARPQTDLPGCDRNFLKGQCLRLPLPGIPPGQAGGIRAGLSSALSDLSHSREIGLLLPEVPSTPPLPAASSGAAPSGPVAASPPSTAAPPGPVAPKLPASSPSRQQDRRAKIF